MRTSVFVALATVLLASPAFAQGGAGSTVNISTTSSTFYSDRISEVTVTGEGTHVFPDPYTAPELTQQSVALEAALVALGFPPGTNASILGTEEIDEDEVVQQSFTSNYNPIDNPDYVIGDPEDPFTWIAIGPEDVNVFFTQSTTYFSFYRMTAEIPADCAAGTYSATGQEPCTPCAAGTFASMPGQASCSDCGPGTFELDPGSSACDPCPGGQATPCNGNGVCSDGPSGNGTCVCNVGYSGFACENGPPTTTTTSMTTTTTDTSSTTTTLPAGPCAELPQTGCVAATVAGLQIQTNTDPARNKLKWKLGGGSLEVAHAALGDPATLTSWTLCIYDSSAGVPFLAGFVTVGPGSSLWTGKEGKGWKYKDKTGSQDGVTGVALKPGLAGKPKAQLKGAGTNLTLPLPFDAMSFFDQDSTVTVQLVKEGGAGGELCWTSELDAADTKLNTTSKFKATAK